MSFNDSSPNSFAKKLLKSLSRKNSIKRLEFKPAEPDSSKMDIIEVNNQMKKKKNLGKRLSKQLSGSFKKLVGSRSQSTTSSSASNKNSSWPTAESVSDSKDMQENSVSGSVMKESPSPSLHKQQDTIPVGFVPVEVKQEEALIVPADAPVEIPETEDVKEKSQDAEPEAQIAKEVAEPQVLPSADSVPQVVIPPADIPVTAASELPPPPTTTLAMAPAPRTGFFRSLLTTAVLTVAVAAVTLGTGALPRMGGSNRKGSAKGSSGKSSSAKAGGEAQRGNGSKKEGGFLARLQKK